MPVYSGQSLARPHCAIVCHVARASSPAHTRPAHRRAVRDRSAAAAAAGRPRFPSIIKRLGPPPHAARHTSTLTFDHPSHSQGAKKLTGPCVCVSLQARQSCKRNRVSAPDLADVEESLSHPGRWLLSLAWPPRHLDFVLELELALEPDLQCLCFYPRPPAVCSSRTPNERLCQLPSRSGCLGACWQSRSTDRAQPTRDRHLLPAAIYAVDDRGLSRRRRRWWWRWWCW